MMKTVSDAVIVSVAGIEAANAAPKVVDNKQWLGNVIGEDTLHYTSRKELATGWASWRKDVTSLLYDTAYRAFQNHHCLDISPEVFWYAICHEVAICVKQAPEKYAYLFTDMPEKKQKITVVDNHLVYCPSAEHSPNNWGAAINLFNGALRQKMSSETVDFFLPALSTMSAEDETAILISFMDIVSSYYDFEMRTLCGIPKLRIRGTHEDWNSIADRLEEIGRRFDELRPYTANLKPVILRIADTVSDPNRNDQDFWKSVYKYQSMSGSSSVTGWLSALTAYRKTKDGFVLHDQWGAGSWRDPDEFPSHVSRVEFMWQYLGTTLKMNLVGGVMGVELDDGFLTPKLGYAVIEMK